MVKISGINNAPVFCPVVGDFYSGMEVTVPLFKSDLNDGFGLSDIKEVYKNKYTGPIVTFCDDLSENGFISAGLLSGKDSMIVSVFGHEDREYYNLERLWADASIMDLSDVVTPE